VNLCQSLRVEILQTCCFPRKNVKLSQAKYEDALLIDLTRMGMEWHNIPKRFPRRTEKAHKNHYYKYLSDWKN